MSKLSPMLRLLSKRIPIPLHLRSECGQMAIFVALIFQVLFVFFAMAINVGLVVHDKINLQNSVDLAAYYAAQRQAEWLNVIAHQNYQIRQSFKVYAWRYRVLGTLGRTDHPSRVGGVDEDAPYSEAYSPSVCVTYQPNFIGMAATETSSDNICKSSGLSVPAIKLPIGFGPINAALVVFTNKINQSIQAQCGQYGAVNYFYTNAIRYAFQLDQMHLKKSIYKIAENLGNPLQVGAVGSNSGASGQSGSSSQMIDINGGSVYEGAKNTFEKNLTFENRKNYNLTLINSIGRPPLSKLELPGSWLHELYIRVESFYRNVKTQGGCFAEVLPASQPPSASESQGWNFILQQTGLTRDQVMAQFVEPSSDQKDRLSLGFEKNPWIRLYVKATGQTQPRQVFFPFGEPIVMTATAYAQPFGGTIGPWNRNNWTPGATASSGGRVDDLVPPMGDQPAQPGTTEGDKILPNYARFPGDSLGLQSALAQSILGGAAPIRASFKSILSALDYSEISDPLSWAKQESGEAALVNVRKYEIMAAAPDLFDIAYYSIEPNYGRTYLPKLLSVAGQLGIDPADYPRPDLGGRRDVDELKDFSVQDQMAVASGAKLFPIETSGNPQNFQNPNQFWVVRKREHLLTGWVPNKAIGDFTTFPDDRFASCDPGGWDDDFRADAKIPGSCVMNGGRTGYSVKIVSGDFLEKPAQLGGPGITGIIVNPPSSL